MAGWGRVALGGGEKVGEARAPDHAGVRLEASELYSQTYEKYIHTEQAEGAPSLWALVAVQRWP